MGPGRPRALLLRGRSSCTGELPRRVTAALAQNLLNHAKPLRRDRMREKVLNYLTKLGIGKAKIPTSWRKPDRGHMGPEVTHTGYCLCGWQQRAQSKTKVLTSTYSSTCKGQPISSYVSQALVLNTDCAQNDSICLFNFLSSSVSAFKFPVTEIHSGKRTSQLQCSNPATPCMTWVFEEHPRARCTNLCTEQGDEPVLALQESDVQ